MPRFSDRTIALVRRNVNEMLTESCTIQRESGSRGTMGEPVHQFENVATAVACRVIRAGQTQSTSEAGQVGGQEALVEMYRLICPVDTPFTTDDRVVMSDGRVFQVVDVEDGLSDSAFAGAVMVRVRV